MRQIDTLLDQYSADHQNRTNQIIHVLCVPPIVWSVIAMLWTVPVPTGWFQPGAVAALAMVASALWYWKLSRKLGAGMVLAFIVCGGIDWWIATQFGMATLFWVALGMFVVAWIGQFIGHIYEGHRPSFLTDLVFLLIGPLWTLRKLYARLGLSY